MKDNNGTDDTTVLESAIPGLPDVAVGTAMPPVKTPRPEPEAQMGFVIPGAVEGDILKQGMRYYVRRGEGWTWLDTGDVAIACRWEITDIGGIVQWLPDGSVINLKALDQIDEHMHFGSDAPSTRVAMGRKENNHQMRITTELGLAPEHIAGIEKLMPGLKYQGDGVFVQEVGPMDEEARQGYMYSHYLTLMNYFDEHKIYSKFTRGVQPDTPWPRTGEWPRGGNFLTGDPLQAPPRPGSKEHVRQGNIRGALLANKDLTVPEFIDALKQHVEQLNPQEGEVSQDPAILALAALERVQEEKRKKKIRRLIFWPLALIILAAIGYGLWQWGLTKMQVGRYTVVANCSVDFAGGQLEGKRYYTYPFKSLFGYHLVDEGGVTEVTELKLPGDTLTVLGYDEAKNKWWRKNFTKGEFGTAKLKPSDKYWFVGEKEKTALVPYNGFCR
jgi:hypothetical protein